MDKPIYDGDRRKVGTVVRTSPDQILLQGHFAESRGLFSYHLRGGKHFGKPVPGATWRIYGDHGELVLTAPAVVLNVTNPETRLYAARNNDDEPQEIPVQGDEWDRLPVMARNIARAYEAFADGGEYPDWEKAVLRHRMIDEMYQREAERKQDVKAEYVGEEEESVVKVSPFQAGDSAEADEISSR
jgi:hypothetical protein